jgi:hypothetical protein
MPVVRIPVREITDWDTFHSVFAEALGFPDWYGRNMDAWIDCVGAADTGDGLIEVIAQPGDVLTLHIDGVDDFALRCPEQLDAIVECSAFVNWRRIEQGERPIIALSFHKSPRN